MPRHRLTFWTNDPVRASWASMAGVDRIGLDLEALGKAARQRDHETWLSQHRADELPRVRAAIGDCAALFARTNPLNASSADEVDGLIAGGAQVLMLPNFQAIEEVSAFLAIVRGRAVVVPLIERRAALTLARQIAELGIEEVHVGLNDLSIELGIRNRFALLASASLDDLAGSAAEAGLSLGLGGLGRARDDTLPVPSDLVYAQHARLGASGALLARSFFPADVTAEIFAAEIERLHARLDHWRAASPQALNAARDALAHLTADTARPL